MSQTIDQFYTNLSRHVFNALIGTALTALIFFASVIAGIAYAGGTYGGGTRNDVNTLNNSNSGAYAGNQGNRQNVIIEGGTVPVHQKISTVPGLSSNFLTNANDTCQGSGAYNAGWLGFGGGAANTYTVVSCDRRQNALVMNNLGERVTAVQLMCSDPTVFTTRKALGLPCVVKPDMTTYALPGGQIGNLAIPTGEKYVAPIEQAEMQPHDHPQYATVPMVDNAFKHGMAK